MADMVTTAGQQMTREEMIAGIEQMKESIKMQKEKNQQLRDGILVKMQKLEGLEKKREVAEVEMEIEQELMAV